MPFYYLRTMDKNQAYKEQNEAFLTTMSQAPGVHALGRGVLYQVLKSGKGASPTPRSIVAVYYKGSLINGKVFDSNTGQGYPDVFRLNELIVGWQIALPKMKVGDKWKIYLPSEVGYGSRGTKGIPKNSTLIFEIELANIG